MTERVVVLSTVGSAEDAERIAGALVARRLAACVNVVPGVRSIYRWKGRVETDDERLLVIKTRRDRFEAVREALVAGVIDDHPVPLFHAPEVLEGDGVADPVPRGAALPLQVVVGVRARLGLEEPHRPPPSRSYRAGRERKPLDSPRAPT